MAAVLPDPFYYLNNFRRVLDWLGQRYADLLDAEEQAFLHDFAQLPQPSQALLVRMVMRKGEVFRLGSLRYAEIGCSRQAVAPLVKLGWVDAQPELTLDQLFALLTLAELRPLLRAPRGMAKAQLRAELGDLEPRTLHEWWPGCTDQAVALRLMPLCDRLRLMFFGNLRQDWSTFVLAELGLQRFEAVELDDRARGFQSRADIEQRLQLHRCREAFETGAEPETLLDHLPAGPLPTPWIERYRARLLFQFGQHCERQGRLEQALDFHAQAQAEPEARIRRLRVLERLERFDEALQEAGQLLLDAALPDPQRQQLQRMLPRLRRQLGLPPLPRSLPYVESRLELCLPRPAEPRPVEQVVLEQLHQPEAPVFYLENALFNSLFGLLCWEAIFAPLPGAFFHPYQMAPADLHASDFHARRAERFAACLARLDDGSHRDAILATYRTKYGILSPFVYWQALDEPLLELALDCLPPAHLRACFERLLRDIRANRAGMPDLVQFLPTERRYRMIEVKGPGDRLQDNQKRWLAFCAEQGMEVQVCYLRWAEATA